LDFLFFFIIILFASFLFLFKFFFFQNESISGEKSDGTNLYYILVQNRLHIAKCPAGLFFPLFSYIYVNQFSWEVINHWTTFVTQPRKRTTLILFSPFFYFIFCVVLAVGSVSACVVISTLPASRKEEAIWWCWQCRFYSTFSVGRARENEKGRVTLDVLMLHILMRRQDKQNNPNLHTQTLYSIRVPVHVLCYVVIPMLE
jgi:hypothetical protein